MRKQPRPAENLAREAVLLTVARMLREPIKLDSITIPRIAEHAGVARATISKLWPADELGSVRPAIFAECLDRVLGQVPALDLGSLEAELQRYLRHLSGSRDRVELSGILRGLLAPPLEGDAAAKRAWRACLAIPAQIARRARARGELAAGVDVAEAADLVWSAAFSTLLAPKRPGRASVDAMVTRLGAALSKPAQLPRVA